MNDLTQEEIQRRAAAYPDLVQALRFTTTSLKRSNLAGAEVRVNESDSLLLSLGEAPSYP
jgi:hypothetical protein